MNKKYLVTVKDIFSGDELDKFLVVGEIHDLKNKEIVEKRVSEIVKTVMLCFMLTSSLIVFMSIVKGVSDEEKKEMPFSCSCTYNRAG